MPTEIRPARSRRLTWRQTAAVVGLLARVRFLNWRMERASARLSDREDAADSAALLAGARQWVALHVRLAGLFGEPGGSGSSEPPALHTPTADHGSAQAS